MGPEIQLIASRTVEFAEEEGPPAHLLHLAASLADALKRRAGLVGGEAANEDVATLSMLTRHAIEPMARLKAKARHPQAW